MLVPKLRFKREDGTDYPEWRYARTDEIAEINPKTSDLPNRFYYMDLGSVSKGAWQEKTITDKDNAPSRANRLASVGDVFFQSVRPYNMGHFFFEEEYEYPVVASTGFIQLRATQEYYNGFIYQLLYEDRFNAEVSIRCTGSNYPAINSENFSDIEMLFPCLEEQQKIADFLSAVDEVIAQTEAEVQNLEQQKKAAMQKIFSQEVRFKREDGSEYPEWEEKTVAEIFKITRGYVLSTKLVKSFADNEYCYPVFSSQTKDNGLMGYYNEYLYENAITWTTDGANAGTVRFRKGKFYCTNVCGVLLNETGFANQCIAEYLNSVAFKYVSYVGNPKLMNNIMAEIPIIIPCLEEQQKIADFLSTYDEVISYAKQELDKWKELKKGLLQQMFV